MNKGNFFVVRESEFASACELGLNTAVLYLVMACGTCRNNTTTSWSAKAANTYAGIAWRKAKAAIELLQEHKLVDKLSSGKRPRYTLAKPLPPHNLIWLPSSLIISRDDAETTPIAKLRQTQSLELLRLFISFYTLQNLESRSYLFRISEPTSFEKTPIRDLGQHTLFGFRELAHISSLNFSAMNLAKNISETENLYCFLELIGLIQRGVYFAEADTPTSDLIHPIVDNQMMSELLDAISSFKQEGYDFAIPIRKELINATLVTVWQLTHQPKTSRIAAEYDIHVENCEKHAAIYRQIHSEFFSVPLD